MKRCPYCAEEIQDEALICRYCGSVLDREQVERLGGSPAIRPATVPLSEGAIPTPRTRHVWRFALPAGFLAALLASVPRLVLLPTVIADAAAGHVTMPYLRGYETDLALHFLLNWLLWTIGVAVFLGLWHRSKAAALLTSLALIAAAVAFVYLPGAIGTTTMTFNQPLMASPSPSSAVNLHCPCPLASAGRLEPLTDGSTVCISGTVRLPYFNTNTFYRDPQTYSRVPRWEFLLRGATSQDVYKVYLDYYVPLPPGVHQDTAVYLTALVFRGDPDDPEDRYTGKSGTTPSLLIAQTSDLALCNP